MRANSLQGLESDAMSQSNDSFLTGANANQAVVEYAKERLSSSPKAWLLVFDGFDHPETFPGGLQPFIPQVTHGCVLVTTTESTLECLDEEKIELSTLSEFQAISLLFKDAPHLDRVRDRQTAVDLVRALKCFTLSVAQARACIAYARLQIRTYLKDYLAQTVSLSRQLTAEHEFQLSIFGTWELSLVRMGGSETFRKVKEHFLLLFGFFDRSNITEDLFRDYLPPENDSHQSIFWSDEGKWQANKFRSTI